MYIRFNISLQSYFILLNFFRLSMLVLVLIARGWSARDGLVAAVSEDTGKVLDVIYLTRECSKCKGMEEKRSRGEVSRIEFLSWYIAHEPSCLLNHEGSAQVLKQLHMHVSTEVYAYRHLILNRQFILCLSSSSLWNHLVYCNFLSVQFKSIKFATFLSLVMVIPHHTVNFV